MTKTIEQRPTARKRGAVSEQDWDRWLTIGRDEARREAGRRRKLWRHTEEDCESAALDGQLRAVEFREQYPSCTDDECAEQCQRAVRSKLRSLRVSLSSQDFLTSTLDEEPATPTALAAPVSWAQFSPDAHGSHRLSHSSKGWRRQFLARFPRSLGDHGACVTFNSEVIDDLVKELEELLRAKQATQGQEDKRGELLEYKDVIARLRIHRQALAESLAEWVAATLKLECKTCDAAVGAALGRAVSQRWIECEHTAGVTFLGRGRQSPERVAESQVKQAAAAWMTELFRRCGIHQESKRMATKHTHDDDIALAKELETDAERAKREAKVAARRAHKK